jgi:hypothetical protein
MYVLFCERKLILIAGSPLENTENKTEPIKAITNENATNESTDKIASPTCFLLIPQIVAKIATTICTGINTNINNKAPGISVKKNPSAKIVTGKITIIELVNVVAGFRLLQGYCGSLNVSSNFASLSDVMPFSPSSF